MYRTCYLFQTEEIKVKCEGKEMFFKLIILLFCYYYKTHCITFNEWNYRISVSE